MLPLIPILLIGKLVFAVPSRNGPLYEDELPAYLRIVGNAPTQHVVNSTAGLLTAFHTILVLLQASYPGNNFNEQGSNHRKYMKVASFDPAFVEKNDHGEIIAGKLKDSPTIIENLKDTVQYTNLINSFDKIFPEHLESCFKQLSTLPNTFRIEDCLLACLKSVNIQRVECLKSALELCHSVLLSSNLEEAKGWLKDSQPNPLTETAQWLKQHLGIQNTLSNQLNTVTDDKSKWILRRVHTMLDQSGTFYKEIINHLDWVEEDGQGNLVNKGNDIKEAIDALVNNLDANTQKDWKNLQSALFGATGWHIVNQARYAAGQISYAFKLSGV